MNIDYITLQIYMVRHVNTKVRVYNTSFDLISRLNVKYETSIIRSREKMSGDVSTLGCVIALQP